MHRSRFALPGLLAIAAVSAAIVLWAPGPTPTTVATLVLCGLVPGWLLAVLALGDDGADTIERTVQAVGLGFVVLVAGGLALHYAPGGITPGLVVTAAGLLTGGLAVLTARSGRNVMAGRVPRRVGLQVLALLVLAAALRLPNLGYAELQGDEATILLKAAAAVEGRADALFVHKKGPAEILVPALSYGAAGLATETSARLPFALAMMAGLLALYQVARALFGGDVAFVAALLLSVNGFFVGFGRIVQYQSLVFLLSTLAVLAAYRAYQGNLSRRQLALAVVFVSVGVLAHYDAVLAVPPVAALALLRWRDRPDRAPGDVAAIAAAAGVGALLLAAFYVPMALHPYFREATLPYIFDVRVGGEGGPFYNALHNSVLLAVYYNSTYYMAFLAVTLLAGLTYHLRRTGPNAVGLLLAAGFVVGSVLVVAAPEVFAAGGTNLTIVFLMAAAAALLASRSPSREWKVVFVWFAAGFILYATLVRSPRTHFHVAFPPWSVLSAVALVQGYRALPRPAWRRAATAAFALALAVFGWYQVLVFVQHEVEYRRAFPTAKPPGYWLPLEDLPTNGWFGFPYRAGWKAVGAMVADGRLQGTYWSNEEENVTDWYTRGAPRCDAEPRYYVLAENVQDVRPVPEDPVAAGYAEIAEVTVDGQRRIRVFERDAAPGTVPAVQVEAAEPGFDREAHARFEPLLPYAYDLGFVQHRLEADFDGRARLLGYALDTTAPEAGGELVVSTYWTGQQPMRKDYSVFVHLQGPDGAVVGQSDGAPGVCGDAVPATTWRPGRIVFDRRAVRIPRDAPPGRYVPTVGLYDYETLERLEVRVEGRPASDRVELGAVDVQPAP